MITRAQSRWKSKNGARGPGFGVLTPERYSRVVAEQCSIDVCVVCGPPSPGVASIAFRTDGVTHLSWNHSFHWVLSFGYRLTPVPTTITLQPKKAPQSCKALANDGAPYYCGGTNWVLSWHWWVDPGLSRPLYYSGYRAGWEMEQLQQKTTISIIRQRKQIEPSNDDAVSSKIGKILNLNRQLNICIWYKICSIFKM